MFAGGKATEKARGCITYLAQTNSEYRGYYPGSQTTRDKLRGQKGNSPDWQLRPQGIVTGKGSEDAETTRKLA